METKNPIESLLDASNSEPIELYDENDNVVKFEQVALIPFKEELYALLKPIDKLEGVEDDEVVVFQFEEDDTGSQVLTVVADDKMIDDVFAVYTDLVKEEMGKKEKKNDKKSDDKKSKPAK